MSQKGSIGLFPMFCEKLSLILHDLRESISTFNMAELSDSHTSASFARSQTIFKSWQSHIQAVTNDIGSIANSWLPETNRSHNVRKSIWQTARLDQIEHQTFGLPGRATDERVRESDRTPHSILVGDESMPMRMHCAVAVRRLSRRHGPLESITVYALIDIFKFESFADANKQVPPQSRLVGWSPLRPRWHHDDVA